MNWTEWNGKKIFVRLSSNRVYQGDVIEVVYMGTDNHDVDIFMITLNDKYSEKVCFTSNDIRLIKEEK